PTPRARAISSFDDRLDSYEGWAKFNRHYWLEHYADFLQFFFSQLYSEPHSTKQIEDCVEWGLETSPETLIATAEAPGLDEARTVPAQACALHLVADRARPRPARRRDRGRASKAAPGPRARLARAAPGHGRARGARRAHPRRERLARQRVAPHRERVGRARPALL